MRFVFNPVAGVVVATAWPKFKDAAVDGEAAPNDGHAPAGLDPNAKAGAAVAGAALGLPKPENEVAL